ncbi:sirohydrochlorin chelatase [Amycolatopsis thermalba]|uniref:Sirohydrochlorin chelatase n=1 Tax=Amycolatopsis thermalba TaxID=944492 RepID=A0ABY4NRN2_9PSEU|nr:MULTISPECIES: sirohydrochlorin chelatase [Amycolatopsis]OXM68315.1 cobalamin biosynthesis protein CbiX [Amycolatopsis sp. KNN50.9b]UQS22706.1 sirohydrochlorin chelatase [Amycolatopsis thermalba]
MIVLAAHGTRDPRGARVIEELADRVRAGTPVPVRVAYADVRQPDVTTVLDAVRGYQAIVVPAFLAAGYHVRTDIPAQIAASGHRNVLLADPFGPAPELVGVMRDRLEWAGYRAGDAVVLAAAGSSDPRALAEVRVAADALGAVLGTSVRVGYVATAQPSIADAVARARGRGRRVAVASWLLAPGLFQRKVLDAGADVVADPLGVHPDVVDLVLARYQQAQRRLAVAA